MVTILQNNYFFKILFLKDFIKFVIKFMCGTKIYKVYYFYIFLTTSMIVLHAKIISSNIKL